MKRFLLLVAVLLASCSSADAYWFWPFPNPELAGWYSQYATIQNGNIVLTINRFNSRQAVADLRALMPTLRTARRLRQPGIGPAQYPPIDPSQLTPGEEAEQLMMIVDVVRQ